MLAIEEPKVVTVRRVKIEQLPLGSVGGDVELMAENYASAHMHGSVCGWSMLRRAWIYGWRAVAFTGTSTPYRQAYDDGLETRRARCLDDDAHTAARLWSDAVGNARLVRQGRELRFILGYKAWHEEEQCPPGRDPYEGYRWAMGWRPKSVSSMGRSLMEVLR